MTPVDSKHTEPTPSETKTASKAVTGLVVAMMAVAVASTVTIVKLWPHLQKS